MKRCIVVQTRKNQDKETKENLLFVSLYRLATKMKDGGLWYAKKDESVITACINETKKPEEYQKFLNVRPGALVDVTFGLNDFNQKIIVADLKLVEGTNIHTDDILFV